MEAPLAPRCWAALGAGIIFPRWNFLICALSQLVNHLELAGDVERAAYRAKAIVRTGIGSERPLHPQQQHVGDYSEALRAMCTTLEIIRVDEPADIFPAYQRACCATTAHTLVVEHGDFYGEK
jgi:hypothetical protein